MAARKKKGQADGHKVLAVNKKARFNYHLLEIFEAGLVLKGWEIKSIRNGSCNLGESYVRVENGELFLIGAHISPYAFARDREVDPVRPRKLLMHKREIARLHGKVRERGFTLVATKVYLKNGRAKLEVALARGKDAPDKRRTVKEREAKREMDRMVSEKR